MYYSILTLIALQKLFINFERRIEFEVILHYMCGTNLNLVTIQTILQIVERKYIMHLRRSLKLSLDQILRIIVTSELVLSKSIQTSKIYNTNASR